MAQPDGGIGNVMPNAALVQMAMSYSRSRLLCAALLIVVRIGAMLLLLSTTRVKGNLPEGYVTKLV